MAAIAIPGPLMKALGMGDPHNLGRLLGVRDLVLGTGLLRGQNTAPGCRVRGVADALDVALIGSGVVTGDFQRGFGWSSLNCPDCARLEEIDEASIICLSRIQGLLTP